MTNQEQYELICEKAEKHDRLVGVIDKIKAEIKEESRFCPLTEGLERALEIIDKYTAEKE